MKWSRLIPVLALMAVFSTSVFAAEIGVRAGRYNDAEEEFVGVEATFGDRLQFNPNIEYILTDNDDLAITANADLLYKFGTAAIKPYVGGGIGVLYNDDDFFGDTTEPLFNVIGGVRWDLEFLSPYVQVKYFKLFEDDEVEGDDIAFTIGLRF